MAPAKEMSVDRTVALLIKNFFSHEKLNETPHGLRFSLHSWRALIFCCGTKVGVFLGLPEGYDVSQVLIGSKAGKLD